jgi:predicted transporter
MPRIDGADVFLFGSETMMLGLYFISLAYPVNPLVNSISNMPLIQGMNAFLSLWLLMNIPFVGMYVWLKRHFKEAVEEALG